jgi:hypothetical protein
MLFLCSCTKRIEDNTKILNWVNTNEQPKICKDTSVKFHVNVSTYGKDISGILFCKYMDDTLKSVFISDAGLKLFEISIIDSNYNVNYCFEKLNKKVLLDLLVKDISWIMSYPFQKTTLRSTSNNFYYKFYSGYVVQTTNPPVWYVTDIRYKKKIQIQYLNENKTVLIVKHYGISFQMLLEKLNDSIVDE